MKFTLKHLEGATYLSENIGKLNVGKMEKFLILLFGAERRREILSMPYEKMYNLFEKTADDLDAHLNGINRKPSKMLRMGGIDFNLQTFGKQTYGWMNDAVMVSEKTPPYELVLLGYVPVGSYYFESDVTETPIYDVAELRDIFMEEMPLIEYYRLQVFFLKQSNKLVWHLEGMQIGIKIKKRISDLKKRLGNLFNARGLT